MVWTKQQMISLTETAAQQIRDRLAKIDNGLGVQIGVKRTGCSGYAYDLQYVTHTPCVPCIVMKVNEVTVFVDPKDEYFVSGLTVDFKKQQFQQSFVFENSKETGKCGCGHSVTFK